MILGVLAYSQLSGTYTIGGTSPNYATFSAAVSALNTQGVSGPVVFNVRNGTYNEQISIGSVTGTSAVNTVTFQSESADNTMVTLYYTPTSGANYTILFNGSDYIRFDKMTLRAVGAAYANVIQFGTNTTYNTVSNCIIEGTNTTSTSTNLALVYSGNTGNNGNAFTGNQFTYGSYGIYFYTTTNTGAGSDKRQHVQQPVLFWSLRVLPVRCVNKQQHHNHHQHQHFVQWHIPWLLRQCHQRVEEPHQRIEGYWHQHQLL